MISENQIENRLCEGVEQLGGLCWKFVSPGRAGVPDRIAMLPGGLIWFIELKAPGKYPDPLQKVVHEMLKLRGQQVLILSNYQDVDNWLALWAGILDKDLSKKLFK